MLDHLRQKAAQALASAGSVILSSCGPAGIQSGRVSSASEALILYVFIPRSSDHLLNLEHRPEVAAATDGWELLGTARVLAGDEVPAAIYASERCANRAWSCVVEIRPIRLTFHSPTGLGNVETIDF